MAEEEKRKGWEYEELSNRLEGLSLEDLAFSISEELRAADSFVSDLDCWQRAEAIFARLRELTPQLPH